MFSVQDTERKKNKFSPVFAPREALTPTIGATQPTGKPASASKGMLAYASLVAIKAKEGISITSMV